MGEPKWLGAKEPTADLRPRMRVGGIDYYRSATISTEFTVLTRCSDEQARVISRSAALRQGLSFSAAISAAFEAEQDPEVESRWRELLASIVEEHEVANG
jgi:hypothetical protein